MATLDDGQKYAGDNYVAATDQAAEQNVIAKKLNERLDIKGGANKDNLTDKNIGVNAVGGALKVQLAKNIDLTDGGSVTTGNTVINNMGLTVGGKTYVSSTGLNANSQVIANVANGSNDNDAVNVSQLKDSRTTVTSSNQSIKVQDTTNGNPNHAYDIMVDYGTVAKNTSISYKANGGTAQTVTLKEGLDFTNGTNTTAEVGANGVVKFNVADSTFKDKARQAVAVEAGDNVTVTPTKDDANHKTTYTVSAADMRVNSGTATYNTDGTGTITLTNNDGTTATVSGLKDTYTKSAAYDAASKKATFTRNDNTTYDLDLSDIANEAGRVKLNFKGDNADTTISRGNSDTLSIVGDGTNISTTGDATKNEIKVALNDNLVLGKDGKDGKDGSIGLVGKNGKDGSVTTIIKTIGKNGADGKNGTPGVNGQDGITRIVYQDGKDGEAGTTTHTVATLDDGLKFGANAAVENGTNPVGNKLNSTIDIVGTKAKDGHTYSADNLTTTVAQDASGKTTITVLMDNAISADSVKVGKDGKDGTNGVDGRLIIKNGKDGKDGADAGIHVIKGEPGVNGKDGETITRVVYNDGKDGKDGKDYTLATTEDGLKFKGDDDTVIAKKLNEQLDIIGGATGALTDKNIAVKSTTDGKLKVQLAKDLTDLNSVTTGDTVMNSDGLTINKAGKAGDKTITISKTTVSYGDIQVNNMGSGADGKDENGKPTYNTDTNGANIGDVKNIAGKTSTDLTAKGLDFVGNDNVKVHRDLGTTLTIQGEGTKDDTNYSGENLKVIGDANGSLTIKMDKDIKGNSVTVGERGADGKDGVDGTIGVNGKDGSAVVINGKDGSIGLNGKDGANGLTIKGDKGAVGVDGTDGKNGKDGMTRIVYQDGKDTDHTVATLDDGMKYAGNFGQGAAVKLNKTVTIKGNLAANAKEDDFVDGNIAVTANKSDDNGELLIKLNKNLTGLNSSTYTSNMTSGGTSTTVVDGSGLKITNGPSITYTGIDAGSHVISHVADGKAPTDAVNVSQLTKVEQEATAHSSVEAGPSGNVTVTPGTNKNGGTKYTVDLADNVNFGKGDKKISINGDNGTVTIGQGDKQIKLDSKDGSISAGGVTINKDGKGTVNGLTNTTWDGEHITSGQAATEDQLQKVEQNVNTKIDNVNNKVDKVAKQHTTVSVNGGNAQGNLVMEKTNATDEKGANYDISLSNDVTIGTQGENGKDGKLTVTSKDGTKAITADGQNGTLTFKDGNNETSIKAAEASKGVDGKTDIKRVAIDGHTVATTDDGMKFAGDSGDVIQQKLNSTTNIKGGATGALTDGNIGVVSDGNNTLTVKLAKDIKGLDSVTATTVNATTVNSSSFNIAGDDSHDAITIKQGDVNMGGNTISGVAPGKVSQDSTDAINGSQLWQRDQAINSIGGAVNKLGSRVNRVGAGAAA